MPEITREEVAHLARLARIDLTDEELDRLAPQLDQILAHVAKVGEVAADDIPPTSHSLPLTNVFRPDELVPGLPAEVALAGAPAAEGLGGRVRVVFSIPVLVTLTLEVEVRADEELVAGRGADQEHALVGRTEG